MELPTLAQKQIIKFLHISPKTLLKLKEKGSIREVRSNKKIIRYFMSDVLNVEKKFLHSQP